MIVSAVSDNEPPKFAVGLIINDDKPGPSL